MQKATQSSTCLPTCHLRRLTTTVDCITNKHISNIPPSLRKSQIACETVVSTNEFCIQLIHLCDDLQTTKYVPFIHTRFTKLRNDALKYIYIEKEGENESKIYDI